MKSRRKITQNFSDNCIFELRWKYIAFFQCRDLGDDLCGNSRFSDFEDEPRSALLNYKYFKVIDIDDTGKAKIKCFLCAQNKTALKKYFEQRQTLKLI